MTSKTPERRNIALVARQQARPGPRKLYRTYHVPTETQAETSMNSLRAIEEEIDRPTAAAVRPRPAEVFEDGGIGAAGVLQGIRHDRQVLEPTLVVDHVGHAEDRRRQPVGINARRGAEDGVEDVP